MDGPALTAAVIVAVGWWANHSVEIAVKTNVAGQLQALLDADVAALEFWLEERRVDARSAARMNRVRQSVVELAEIAGQSDSETLSPALLTSTALNEVRERMRPLVDPGRIEGFVISDRSGLVLASHQDMAVGDSSISAMFETALVPTFEGQTVVIPPFPSVLPKQTAEGIWKVGVPARWWRQHLATEVLPGDTAPARIDVTATIVTPDADRNSASAIGDQSRR